MSTLLFVRSQPCTNTFLDNPSRICIHTQARCDRKAGLRAPKPRVAQRFVTRHAIAQQIAHTSFVLLQGTTKQCFVQGRQCIPRCVAFFSRGRRSLPATDFLITQLRIRVMLQNFRQIDEPFNVRNCKPFFLCTSHSRNTVNRPSVRFSALPSSKMPDLFIDAHPPARPMLRTERNNRQPASRAEKLSSKPYCCRTPPATCVNSRCTLTLRWLHFAREKVMATCWRNS